MKQRSACFSYRDALSPWVEIDRDALRFNVRCLRRRLKQLYGRQADRKKMMAVVKAEAYGHGMLDVARVLVEEGVEFLAVVNVEEGRRLREAGVSVPILVLESTLPASWPFFLRYELTPLIQDLSSARGLNRWARQQGRMLPCHVKVDTGMGRMGIPYEYAEETMITIARLSHLKLEGAATHFPKADNDPAFTKKQLRIFHDLVRRLENQGVALKERHAANSMGMITYPEEFLTVARPGLMIYGCYPHACLQETMDLRPVMSVKARVVAVKDVPPHHGLSYGHTFVTRRRTRVATVGIGYADGFSRRFSNRAFMLIRGRRCPVIGTVTMNQTLVDVTAVPQVRVGDPVVILGRQGRERITAEELAAWSGTINYEIVCAFGARLPRFPRRRV